MLQFTPFIYPPTPFDFGRREHMIIAWKYFPINYFACQNFSTPPPANKKFPKMHRKRALGENFRGGKPTVVLGPLGC
jgi:hypothetical protein